MRGRSRTDGLRLSSALMSVVLVADIQLRAVLRHVRLLLEQERVRDVVRLLVAALRIERIDSLFGDMVEQVLLLRLLRLELLELNATDRVRTDAVVAGASQSRTQRQVCVALLRRVSARLGLFEVRKQAIHGLLVLIVYHQVYLDARVRHLLFELLAKRR